jgi:L-threonylcarbamoyladenylate synthase
MILDGQSPAAITAAAQSLQLGQLVGLPTETVYGLAADATQDAAVARVFSAKGRPSDHPMIVHVADLQDAERFASHIPVFAQPQRLAARIRSACAAHRTPWRWRC